VTFSRELISKGADPLAVARRVEGWLAGESPVVPAHAILIADLYAGTHELPSAETHYQSARRFPETICQAGWGQIRTLFRMGEEARARDLLKTFARQVTPGCTDFVGMLATMCGQGLRKESVDWLDSALAWNHREWFPFMRSVQPCLTEEDLPRVEKMLERVPEREAVKAVLDEIEDGQAIQTLVAPWIQADFVDMIRDARERSIPVVLATYPHQTRPNPLLREIAEVEGIPLVDHEQRFQALLQSGRSRADLFAADGNNPFEWNDHCNATGYEWMASGVLDTLTAEGLLPPGP